MSGSPLKFLPEGLPNWLKTAVEAANDNVELTARQVAEKRWGSVAAEAGKDVAVGGLGETIAIATVVPAFLGTMGLAAYTYLTNRDYYDNKRFTPCGTEPRRATPSHLIFEATPNFSKLIPGHSVHRGATLDSVTRQVVLSYVQSSSATPAIDKPPQGVTIPDWMAEMEESVNIAIAIAEKRAEIVHHHQNGDAHLARRAEQELNTLVAQAETIAGASPIQGHHLQAMASASGDAGSVEGATENVDDDVNHLPLQRIARDQLDKILNGSLQQLTSHPRHALSDLAAYVGHSWPRWLVSDLVLLSVLVPPSVATAVVSGMKLYQHAVQGGESLSGSLFSGVVVGGIVGGACFMAGGFALLALAALGIPDNSSVIKNVIDLRARGSFRLARSLVANSMNISGRTEYRRHVEFDIAASRATLAIDAGDYAAAVKLMRPVIGVLDQVNVERYDVHYRGSASSRARLYLTYGVALLQNGDYTEASRILKKAADDRMSTFMDLTNVDVQVLAATAARRSAQYLLHVTENDAKAIADPEIAAMVADAKIRMQAREYQAAEDILLKASALAEERYNHTADEIALQLLGMTIESRNSVEGERARKRADAVLIQEERAMRDTLSTLLAHEKAALRLHKNGLEFVVARAQLMLDHGRYMEAVSILYAALNHDAIVVHHVNRRQGINQYEYHPYLNDRERVEVWQMLGEAEFAAGKLDSARGHFAHATEKFDQLGLVAKAEESRQWQRMAVHRMGRRAMTPEIAALEQQEATDHMARAVDLESKGFFNRANREYSAALDIYEVLGDMQGMREALAGQEEIAMALGDSITAFQVARFKMTLKKSQ